MPAEVYGERYQFLPKKDILSFEEIARLSGLMVQLGVTKIRLTGGEPLVRSGVPNLVSLLSAITDMQDLTLTTNGYLLTQHAQALKDAGLRRITISLDSLDEEVFKAMNGRGYSSARVLEAVQAAQGVGFDPVKINCVVQKGVNDHTITDLARHFKGTGCIVRFIEYMDVGNLNGWKMDEVVPAQDIFEMINQSMPPGTGGTQLRRRGGPPLSVPGRRRGDWHHRFRDQALLRRMHEAAPLHRWQALHLPFSPARAPTCAGQCVLAPATKT